MAGKEIKISVRKLVEFVLRAGDLDARFMGSSRVLDGTRLHQKLQRRRREEADTGGWDYAKEVAVSRSIDCEGLMLTVGGRIDGVIKNSEETAIEEIKSTEMPLALLEAGHTAHWAQAKCYGYLYASENQMDSIAIHLTYCQLDSEEIKCFMKTFEIEELKAYFDQLSNIYIKWAEMDNNWMQSRNETIKLLAFPFEAYRQGQRKLAVGVYKTIEEGRKLFVQAPTGIGKTISALFPAVKAMGEGHSSKIFYLTAKTATRQIAVEAVQRMAEKGLKLKTLVLTAKEKLCFKDEVNCNPEYCEYAKGYFDKVGPAVWNALLSHELFTRETIIRYGSEYGLCPFEFSLDLAEWVDCIICDYNYVFDPRVYLKRFFQEAGGDYIFLIDEAHNLVDRSREMFSAELMKKPFLELKRLMKSVSPELSKAAGRINSFMVELRKNNQGKNSCTGEAELKELYKLLEDFVSLSEVWLGHNERSALYKELLERFFEVSAFMRICELFDERYEAYVEILRNDMRLKLFCLDPSHLLMEASGRGKVSIFFSATLTPLHYFKEILGGKPEDHTMRLSSPFDREHLCLLISDTLSVKYKNREDSYRDVAAYIKATASGKKGNYLVFFPSYRYMEEIGKLFAEEDPELRILQQIPVMGDEEREKFLACFEADSDTSLLGFAVIGGIFSEGIDLVGDRLSGVVIVGVGLPQVCYERDIIMDYFKEKCGRGFEYAYQYPGMNKVLQAAGRVIRTEEDRGIVLLIDDRYTTKRYLELFPQEWQHYRTVGSLSDLQKRISNFWA